MHLTSRAALAAGLAAGLVVAMPSPVAAAGAGAAKPPKNAILLSQVQSLTLRDGRMTTHRRVPAVPQLACTANPPRICDLYTIDTMRCTNQGSGYDDEDIQWSCTASLPPELKLGGTDVVCEGYSSSNDPYVLKGSCGVQYRLLLTDYGEEKYPDLARGGDGSLFDADNTTAWLFWVVFVAIAAWIVWGATAGRNPNVNGNHNQPGWGWGGGGGGGGGGPGFGPGNDPPPPYPGTKPSDHQQQQQQQWRPGFWSGLAGGAAAGYLAGNRNNNNNNNRGYLNRDYDRDYGTGGGWGGSPGPSTRPVSSARNPSTGFGSTSRR